MNVITVDTEKLIGTIRTNRDAHEKTYEQVLAEYRRLAIEWLEEMTEAYAQGEYPRLTFDRPRPKNHLADYNQALQMLELHIGETIDVDDKTFARLVLDDWEWRAEWVMTTRSYGL